MTTANMATAKEVGMAVASLGFQVTPQALGAISRVCRDDFLEHLSRCVSGQDADGTSTKFVGNLVRCLSPEIFDRVTRMFPSATLDMVVPIARSVPTKFQSAIAAAFDSGHERHADAKAYLGSIFQPDSFRAPTDAAPGVAQPSPATQPEGEPEMAAQSAKKYRSAHVYGSSAALCFNATNWDGAPGVMVDAAAQTGPKTYDWKNAVHFWLDINEVGAVLAVFRRWRKGIEFAAHGAQNDKSFAIEFQGQHFFAKVTAKKAGVTRAVKILPTDATAVSILFLTQLADSYPSIPLNELLATVRATHRLEDAAAA